MRYFEAGGAAGRGRWAGLLDLPARAASCGLEPIPCRTVRHGLKKARDSWRERTSLTRRLPEHEKRVAASRGFLFGEFRQDDLYVQLLHG